MKLPNSYYNSVSFYGTLIAGFNLLLIIVLILISLFSDSGGGYLGLITYLILPIFLIIGLLMIPLGMWIKVRRIKKGKPEDTRWKVIDLNDRRTRNAMIIFVVGTFIFLFLSAIGSYQAYHYTESNKFCGTTCHSVMEPEYTAYQNSSHARVKCVECHVGEGADWYVKSKLSGAYQVYAVLTDNYPRPIPTPISNLRPAQETCEKCHWPNKFYSNRIVNNRSFLADSANSAYTISLQMKTSSDHSSEGLNAGIHWHINPDVKIEYISESKNRDTIPWIKYTNTATGETVIYQDQTEPLTKSKIDSLNSRTMDCMDCHNRPSHLYNAPSDYIDMAFNSGEIPEELPYIKQITMQVLKERFLTKDSALNFINDSITDFYKTEHPDIYADMPDKIEKAVRGVQAEFSENAFPRMKVYHDAYTDHIGHMQSPGCFRCHSGNHADKDGNLIRTDCKLCHNILAQGSDTAIVRTNIGSSLDFKHPVDIYGAWRDMHCSECHGTLY